MPAQGRQLPHHRLPRVALRPRRRHIARAKPQACPCHGLTYVYSGRGIGGAQQRGPTLRDVAKLAGVSTGTVSNVLNRPEMVAGKTRARVEKAIAEVGFVHQVGPSREAAHWRRSGHATWIFTPAATGWYPRKAPNDAHPVPVLDRLLRKRAKHGSAADQDHTQLTPSAPRKARGPVFLHRKTGPHLRKHRRDDRI